MPPAGSGVRPRKVCGGRSPRYEGRRTRERTNSRQNAAEWSDAAAQAVLSAIHTGSAAAGQVLKTYVISLLTTPGGVEQFVAGLPVTQAQRALAATILATHAARMGEATDVEMQRRRARALLKPLRDRRAQGTPMGKLEVPPTQGALGTFHKWLSPDPSKDRKRDIRKSKRIVQGISRCKCAQATMLRGKDPHGR